jgi:hypothetical protein
MLLIEDDLYYQLFTDATLEQSEVFNQAYYVKDAQECFDYLWREQKYGDPRISPRPNLILLNLDIVNAQPLLEQIEANSDLRAIPIALLSKAPHKSKIYYKIRNLPILKNPLSLSGLSQLLDLMDNHLNHDSLS